MAGLTGLFSLDRSMLPCGTCLLSGRSHAGVWTTRVVKEQPSVRSVVYCGTRDRQVVKDCASDRDGTAA
ncbi:MAG: hypothetical protein JNM31_14320 [Flavobacteriales bacterium]|nr:hypothetical protein [Flavobacteriales bacterium]